MSGGITIQQSVQSGAIENGTIQFSDSNGLELYHNGWIPVDAQDTDTTLLPGHGFKLDGVTFDLDSMDANKNDVFNFNGSMWLPAE